MNLIGLLRQMGEGGKIGKIRMLIRKWGTTEFVIGDNIEWLLIEVMDLEQNHNF